MVHDQLLLAILNVYNNNYIIIEFQLTYKYMIQAAMLSSVCFFPMQYEI